MRRHQGVNPVFDRHGNGLLQWPHDPALAVVIQLAKRLGTKKPPKGGFFMPRLG
jgi:hypothetical protein